MSRAEQQSFDLQRQQPRVDDHVYERPRGYPNPRLPRPRVHFQEEITRVRTSSHQRRARSNSAGPSHRQSQYIPPPHPSNSLHRRPSLRQPPPMMSGALAYHQPSPREPVRSPAVMLGARLLQEQPRQVDHLAYGTLPGARRRPTHDPHLAFGNIPGERRGSSLGQHMTYGRNYGSMYPQQRFWYWASGFVDGGADAWNETFGYFEGDRSIA